MPDYYPIMLDVRGRIALVVGGGDQARDKASALAKAGALVQSFAGRPPMDVVREAFIVLSVTQDRELIHWLKLVMRPHQLLHVMDRPADSAFVCPSVLQRGAMTVSVSTDGTCPAMARLVRQRLEGVLGPEWEAMLALAADARARLQQAGVPPARRSSFFDKLMGSEALEHLRNGERAAAHAVVSSLLEGALSCAR